MDFIAGTREIKFMHMKENKHVRENVLFRKSFPIRKYVIHTIFGYVSKKNTHTMTHIPQMFALSLSPSLSILFHFLSLCRLKWDYVPILCMIQIVCRQRGILIITHFDQFALPSSEQDWCQEKERERVRETCFLCVDVERTIFINSNFIASIYVIDNGIWHFLIEYLFMDIVL